MSRGIRLTYYTVELQIKKIIKVSEIQSKLGLIRWNNDMGEEETDLKIGAEYFSRNSPKTCPTIDWEGECVGLDGPFDDKTNKRIQ